MVENVLVTFDDFPLTAVIHMDEISNPATIMLKYHTNVFDKFSWIVGYWLFLLVFPYFLILLNIISKTSFFTAKETKHRLK